MAKRKYCYTLKQVDKLIDTYIGLGGNCATVEEGGLGYGTTLLYGAVGYKTIVIKEVPVNAYESVHTLTRYKNMPKKYQKKLDAYYERIEDYMATA